MDAASKVRAWINRDDGRIFRVDNAPLSAPLAAGALLLLASLVAFQFSRLGAFSVALPAGGAFIGALLIALGIRRTWLQSRTELIIQTNLPSARGSAYALGAPEHPMHIPEEIRSALTAGEQVIWSGQPRQGLTLRGSDVFAIPFSLLFAGFSVFWMYAAAASGAPLPLVLFGVPFVLVGLFLVFGRFFLEAKQRAGTYYALTPQRIIIRSGVFTKTVKSLPLKTLRDLSLSERSDGTGTITFGAQHPMASMFGGMPGWPGMDQYLGPRFDRVPQARGVYEAIRKAQASAA